MNSVPPLSQPHIRGELQAYLLELQATDPRPIWQAERQRGLISGIDQVFHFMFDDHDFDDAEIGATLVNHDEVRLIEALKDALNAVLEAVGDAGDDAFVSHPLWLNVTRTAAAAERQLARVG